MGYKHKVRILTLGIEVWPPVARKGLSRCFKFVALFVAPESLKLLNIMSITYLKSKFLLL